MFFFLGVLGFGGFEILRLYKNQSLNKPQPSFCASYWVVVALTASFSGIITELMNPGSVIHAVFIGFSVPSCAKVFLESGEKEPQMLKVDDVEIERRSNVVSSCVLSLKDSFRSFFKY